MKDVSGQSFKYSGKKYTFVASLHSLDGEVNVTLDNNAVRSFEYESCLNELTHRGSIEYVDAYGNVDKLLEKTGSYCEIFFVENEQKMDGPLTLEKYSDVNRLQLNFLVENVGILGRNSNQIEYRIELVSQNVYRCVQTVDFTNYGKRPEDVVEILKQCYALAQLDPDRKSFDDAKSGVKLNYITNGNDTPFTITKYLLNKLYYYFEKDDSMKFVYWNESDEKIKLFDVADVNSSAGFYAVTLSLLKSKHESFVEEEQQQLATVTKFPASQNMRAVFGAQVSTYDRNLDVNFKFDVESKSFAEYFNSKFESNDALLNKMQPVDKSRGMSYVRRGSYWNNDFDTYGEMTKNFFKNNSLLIETSGVMLRKPSSVVTIGIDRDQEQMPDEQKKNLDDIMTRYRGLEGQYYVVKVHNFIFPQQGRYRQALTLARNFTVDLSNKK